MSHGGQTKTSLPVEEILAARKDPNYKRKSKPAASKAMNLAWLSMWWMRMEREGQADQKQKCDTQPIRQFMVDTNNEKRKKRKAQHHLCTPTSKKGTEESYAQPPHTTPESGKDDMTIITRHPAMMSGTLSRNITDVLYECNPTQQDWSGFSTRGEGSEATKLWGK